MCVCVCVYVCVHIFTLVYPCICMCISMFPYVGPSQGRCVCGECQCNANFTQSDCGCPLSDDACVDPSVSCLVTCKCIPHAGILLWGFVTHTCTPPHANVLWQLTVTLSSRSDKTPRTSRACFSHDAQDNTKTLAV